MLSVILQALFLSSALCLDALAASFSYGINKIKIPIKSVIIINIIASAFLAASLVLGNVFSLVLNPTAITAISSGILIIIGLVKLFDSFIKSKIRKNKIIDKSIKFKFLSLKFILKIYADPEEADIDKSKVLSIKESIPIAVALSIDSLVAGFGVGVAGADILINVSFAFATGFIAVFLGAFWGMKLADKSSINLSWLSGAILIGLGIFKIFF